MIEDHGWSYGLIQKAKVRPRHHQIHSENTCVLVPPHGRAGRLFRDFLFLNGLCVAKCHVGSEPQHSQQERNRWKTWESVTGNGGGLGCA